MEKSHAGSRARAVLGGKKSKSKGGKPHRLEIRHGKNGGHVVTHHYQPSDDGNVPEPEEHILPDKAALLDHISQNVPDQAAPPPTPDAAQGGGAPISPMPQGAPQGM